MRNYKLWALIISGVCMILFVIIVMTVFGLNNNNNGYNADSDYRSINNKEEKKVQEKVQEEIAQEKVQEKIIEEKAQEKVQEKIQEEIKKGTNNNKLDDKEDIRINNKEETEISNKEEMKINKKKESAIEVKTVPVDATNNIESESKDEEKVLTLYTGNEWVDDKICENKDQISDTDLQRGLAIGDKLDMDLVMAYLEDGLTDDERVSLKKYLESVLSDSEYETVKVLIGRYSSMID